MLNYIFLPWGWVNSPKHKKVNKLQNSIFGAEELKFILLVELLYTAACIYQLLLTRKERVAFVANINLQRFNVFGSTGLERSSASAYNRNFMIIGMYLGLHTLYLAKINQMLNYYITIK